MKKTLKNLNERFFPAVQQQPSSDEELGLSTLKQRLLKRVTAFVLILATLSPSPGWCPPKFQDPEDDRPTTHQGPLVSLPIPDVSSIDLKQGVLIGRGSFGDVYRGNWRGLEVAIKKLHMQILTPSVIQDFNTEAQMMWNCRFPNILRLHGVCREPGQTAMVLELMSRGSLFELLHSPEDISERQSWQIAIDVAQGLTDLHGSNILHRDLKSLNILLDESYRAKISDFGLSKLRLNTNTTSTQAKPASVGTVRWRAPELFGLKPKTTLALDMYSYGMVLWELVSRKKPFEEQPDDLIVISAVKAGEREEIPSHCPPVWRSIIEDCWKQEPEKRPSAANILERLRQAQPKLPLPRDIAPVSDARFAQEVLAQISRGFAELKTGQNATTAHLMVLDERSRDIEDHVVSTRVDVVSLKTAQPSNGAQMEEVDQMSKNREDSQEKEEQRTLQENQMKEEIQRLFAKESQMRLALHQSLEQDYAQMSQILRDQFDRTRPAAKSIGLPPTGAVPRLAVSGIVIPEIAKGYEDVYRRFYNGKLIYRPTEGSDVGKIEMPIAALANPLDGDFDLKNCGDTGNHLSIATGYRKGQIPANADKLEIWFTFRFLVDKEMTQLSSDHHMRKIITDCKWDGTKAPVGIFWTWGGWKEGIEMGWGEYLTTESMDEFGSENLYKKHQKAGRLERRRWWIRPRNFYDSLVANGRDDSSGVCEPFMQKFHVVF